MEKRIRGKKTESTTSAAPGRFSYTADQPVTLVLVKRGRVSRSGIYTVHFIH